MARNVSSWLPNLTGPLDLQVEGTAVDVPRRGTINFVGFTVTDDPDNERTDIAADGEGTPLANASTGTLNNVTTTAVSTIRHSGAAPTVNGYTGGSAGRRLVVLATGGDVILANEAAASTAANRIITGTGASVTVANGSGALLVNVLTRDLRAPKNLLRMSRMLIEESYPSSSPDVESFW